MNEVGLSECHLSRTCTRYCRELLPPSGIPPFLTSSPPLLQTALSCPLTQSFTPSDSCIQILAVLSPFSHPVLQTDLSKTALSKSLRSFPLSHSQSFTPSDSSIPVIAVLFPFSHPVIHTFRRSFQVLAVLSPFSHPVIHTFRRLYPSPCSPFPFLTPSHSHLQTALSKSLQSFPLSHTQSFTPSVGSIQVLAALYPFSHPDIHTFRQLYPSPCSPFPFLTPNHSHLKMAPSKTSQFFPFSQTHSFIPSDESTTLEIPTVFFPLTFSDKAEASESIAIENKLFFTV